MNNRITVKEGVKARLRPDCGRDNGFQGRRDSVFRITRIAGRILFSPFFCLHVEGSECLPRKSAFVLLSKHQRWEDIPLLSFATTRPLYYVAKYELFQNPFSYWYLTSLGGIPLNRKRPIESRRYLKAVIEFLKNGEGVVVFPEGTYFRGKMGPGHAGIVRLLLSRLSVPFVPVGVRYIGNGLRTKVVIRFGQPFHADNESRHKDLLDHMMGEIARLSQLGPYTEKGCQSEEK